VITTCDIVVVTIPNTFNPHNFKVIAFNKPMTIAEVLQCKKSKSSNQNIIYIYTIH